MTDLYKDLLIGVSGGVIGAVIGFLLSLWLVYYERKKKLKALQEAFYREFRILKLNLEGWLLNLDDEFKKTVTDTYSGLREFDFRFLEALSIEIISSGGLLSQEQREFQTRIENKIEGIKVKEEKRDEDIDKSNEAAFRIPRHHTSYLLCDVVEAIYFLNKFIDKKDAFLISHNNASPTRQAMIAYKLAGVEFELEIWESVLSFNPHLKNKE
ncbi:hypothetical protein [Alteromonas sp. a30]|uniref:hypothetical protein n=1 Tax=Alteromonas sp. a30 TaxID=2730917 RepID=UPI00227F3169|nr:hypothetical protein [Alteromonas sp. a30]MCY7295808.1 hypothetical protein [Alteromonas sp. a30]